MLKESLAVAIFALGASVAAAQNNLTIVPKQEARCVSTTMTSAFFLKIDEIRGDSLDKCHHDEIELMAFQNSVVPQNLWVEAP